MTWTPLIAPLPFRSVFAYFRPEGKNGDFRCSTLVLYGTIAVSRLQRSKEFFTPTSPRGRVEVLITNLTSVFEMSADYGRFGRLRMSRSPSP